MRNTPKRVIFLILMATLMGFSPLYVMDSSDRQPFSEEKSITVTNIGSEIAAPLAQSTILHSYDFEDNTIGQNPTGPTIELYEPPAMGSIHINTLSDAQGKVVQMDKTADGDWIYLVNEFNTTGETYNTCNLHFRFRKTNTAGFNFRIFGTSPNPAFTYYPYKSIITLAIYNGQLRNYQNNANSYSDPYTVIATYQNNMWYDVQIAFNASKGWTLILNNTVYGADYGLGLSMPDPGPAFCAHWSSCHSGGGLGTFYLDDIEFAIQAENIIINEDGLDSDGIQWNNLRYFNVSCPTDHTYNQYQLDYSVLKNDLPSGIARLFKWDSASFVEIPYFVEDFNSTHYKVWWNYTETSSTNPDQQYLLSTHNASNFTPLFSANDLFPLYDDFESYNNGENIDGLGNWETKYINSGGYAKVIEAEGKKYLGLKGNGGYTTVAIPIPIESQDYYQIEIKIKCISPTDAIGISFADGSIEATGKVNIGYIGALAANYNSELNMYRFDDIGYQSLGNTPGSQQIGDICYVRRVWTNSATNNHMLFLNDTLKIQGTDHTYNNFGYHMISTYSEFYVDSTRIRKFADTIPTISVINKSVPNAPTLTITSPNPSPVGQISLSWNSVPNADNYTVYRHTDYFNTLGGGEVAIDTVTGTTYNDGPLANDTYYYAVVARNESGVSGIHNCESVEVAIIPTNPSSTTHAPIFINGNAELDAFPDKTGSGTDNDPYIIENWIIDATAAIGIDINNTNKSLVIRNCTINNRIEYYEGININQASRILIENNNVFLNNYMGIQLEYSNNCTVSNNNITDCYVGIYLNFSPNCTIVKNNVKNNYLGIWLYGSGICNVTDNRATYNNRGICLEQSSNNRAWKNYMAFNSEYQANSWSTTGNQWYFEETGNWYGDYQARYPEATHDGLVWNTPYEINGNSGDMDNYPLFDNTPFAPPTAPILAITSPTPSTTGQISLSWNSVPNADNYTIYRHTEYFIALGGGEVELDTIAGTTYNDGPLANDTYYYAVVARNESGVSGIHNCESVEVAIPPAPTYPPTGPTLVITSPTPSTTGQIGLSWDGVSGADNYTIYRHTDYFIALGGGEVEVDTITGTTYNDGPLANDTYYYAVVARNESGVSGIHNCEAVEVAIQPETPPETWTVPQPFMIDLDPEVTQPIRVNHVEIRWLDEIVPNASNISFYIATTRFTALELQAGEMPSFVLKVTVDASVLAGLSPGDINRHQFSGLASGTYFICVSYANPLGEAFSNVLEVVVELPEEDTSKDDPPEDDSPFQIDGVPIVGVLFVAALTLIWVRKRQG